MPQVQISLSLAQWPRFGRLAGAVVIGALVLWPAAYLTGVFPWLGVASRSAASLNIGRFPVGELGSGKRFGYGLRRFFAFKGQTIVLAYDADIKSGCLWMDVSHLYGPALERPRCMTASGEGELTLPVDRSGFYRVIVDSFPVKGHWDLSYTVWWGARW